MSFSESLSEEVHEDQQQKRSNWKRWLIVGVILIVLLALAAGIGYLIFYLRNQEGKKTTTEHWEKRAEFRYSYYGRDIDDNSTVSHGGYPHNVPKEEAHLTKTQIVTQGNGKPRMGTSTGYLKAALHLHSSINTSAEPCEDFFEYACGEYLATHPIPSHLRASSEIMRLIEESDNNMKTLLESKETSSSAAIEKMKKMYKSCVKEEEYVEKAPENTYKFINKYGLWPMIEGFDGFDESKFDMQSLMEEIAKEHLVTPSFFTFTMGRDPKNQSHRVAQFDQGDLVLSSMDYYLNPKQFEKVLAAGKRAIQRSLEEFSKDVGLRVNPHLRQDIEELFEFEARIAKVMKPYAELRNTQKTYNKGNFVKVTEEFKKLSGFDLKKFGIKSSHPLLTPLFNEDLEVLMKDAEFPNKLAEILKSTSPRILKNYVLYHVLSKYDDFFGPKYRDIAFELKRDVTGVESQEEDWLRCKKVAEKMPKTFGALYARNHFDQDSKKSTERMIESIKESFKEILEENNWMDEKTKERARIKINEMLSHIGYSQVAFDDKGLDEYYEKLVFDDSDGLVEMSKKLEIWTLEKTAEELMKEVDRNEFFGHAAEINAFFHPLMNAILFPAAILQFPAYERTQPQAMNYGGIGSVIGHEIAHGFDDQGKAYDEKGNLKNWWDEETKKKYEEKAQCMREQYGAIEVPETGGMRINGNLTIGENIADNGGIRESFRAYKKYVEKHGEEPSLPGFDLTGEQLFFHGFANFFCSNERPGVIKQKLIGDIHSPDRFRINVVLQNFPEFSKAFNCPLGSPMNPEMKCAVW